MRIACPSCQKELQVPDNAAGRKGKCSKCGQLFMIPPAGPATDPAAGAPFVPPPPAVDPVAGMAARQAAAKERTLGSLMQTAGIAVIVAAMIGCAVYGVCNMPADPVKKQQFKSTVRLIGTLPVLGGVGLITAGRMKMKKAKANGA